MTQEEITKAKEVMAVFVGGTHETIEIMTYGGRRSGKWNFDDDKWCYDDQLQYDTSWDWLHDVWNKFRILNVPFEVKSKKRKYIVEFMYAVRWKKNPIEAFKVLYEAIVWYNSIKKSS